MRSSNIQKSCTNRALVVFIFVILSYLSIFFKLFNTQVLERKYWHSQALAQHFGRYELPSRRGDIYAKDGFAIAVGSTTYDLFLDPSLKATSFEDLKPIFDYLYKDKEGIEKKEHEAFILEKESSWKNAIAAEDKQFMYLEKGLSEDSKKYIESVNNKSLGFLPIYTRVYPDPSAYSHILGFVGKSESGEDIGYFGIEGYYDGDLRGTSGFVKQERSAFGSPILQGGFESIKELDGANVTTTIDRTIQTIVYQELEKAVEKFGAESGVVIVVNPKSGEIMALANYPTFDPSSYGEYFKDTPDIFINKAISSTYEPGSVIKALTMSSAIDLNLVTPETTMVDSGPVTYSTHSVDNWDGKHHGEINMYQVLQLSNNIGASWVGTKVGSTKLYNYFTDFGLNKKLGVDLEGEEQGGMRPSDSWLDIDLAAASFGQGISTTPLQVIMAFSAIANDGVLMKPYIAQKISVCDRELNYEPTELSRVIQSSTSATMVNILTKAVAGGEASYFVSKKYNVAGKTGTAQIAEKGEYLKDKTNATFVGFLPNYKDFVMLVKLEKPTASVYASETAVPLWMDIAEQLANYLGLPPDKYE